MAYELIHELTESKLLPSKTRLNRYNLRDVADLTFLYYIALEILSKEATSIEFARQYARKTIMFNNFNNFVYTSTDLYVLLHVLTGNNSGPARVQLKDDKENAILAKIIKPNLELFRRYLLFMRLDRNVESFVRRALLEIQDDMAINIENYKSMRILSSQWTSRTKQEKQLVITRLLQALRARALQSELLPELERLAKKHGLELKNVNNPETGATAKKAVGASWWIKPIIAAGAAAAGYALTRDKKK